ncbi:hypothetical protein N8J89_26980 [Crossiella sp. CA-258035]|nr:hypothetical protein [Crossiella sp. CA-258035]WHT16766.1 hypothetical protein N8J89_26980 [Crossiella sp. CA-258035]
MVVNGLAILPEADWIDVFCLHDQHLPAGGIVQVESVDVIVQRVAAVF